ncbi:MAG: UvrD-helicase domain-containing protein [Bacteroidales bacterium]|nr:UvrD-helicase domain-containing protein [Bacteroidales bacterium]
MQQGVTVVTASAGSGKTHRLTQDYIDLLLSGDPQAYKHILAVTFTNKATDEMKSRVLEDLYKLSTGTGHRAELAADRLKRLLHDYTCFSVSTIDKFFQTVMRSFAREIGQYASYRVELDTDAVLSQVVDLLIDSIEEPGNGNLRQWLRDYSFDLVEQGSSWNLEKPLKEMASRFLDESFLLKVRSAGERNAFLGDKASLKGFLAKLDRIVRDWENEAVAIGNEGLALIASHGLKPEDCFQKTRGAAMVFRKWADRNLDAKLPKESSMEAAAGKFPDPAALEAMFGKLTAHAEEPLRRCASARLVRRNIYLLGIYNDLQLLLDNYLKENNVVLLQLSTDILNRIIAEDDTPFVYEKIGNRYDNMLLDEAQDTSLMQWNNFRPLFRNSQAQGGRNLIVGDIKQSIYRWRGSDWRLMRDYLRDDLKNGPLDFKSLKENWRSGKAIMDFNTDVFTDIGNILATDPDRATLAEEISQIYSGCKQDLPPERTGSPQGYVRLEFLPETDEDEVSWKEKSMERMVADIRGLLAEGYDYKDITVLVRTNKEGSEAAAALIAAGISVLTEDSLLIGSSPCISRLMSLLGWVADPDNPVNELQSRDLRDKLPELKAGSLYEVCEQLLDSSILEHGTDDIPFINAFLDAVLAFQEKYGSSLRAFVKWWEESGHKKSICAPDGQDAVRVMTIHKAKGLSIKAVIIPFCTESFTRSTFHLSTIWCRTEEFGEPLLVPLKSSGKLKGTFFETDYERERTLEHIDVVNNWYVAFTRPKSRLLIYAPLHEPSKKDGFKPYCIENALFLHFHKKPEDPFVFESGLREAPSGTKKESKTIDDPQPAFSRVAMDPGRLKLTLRGEDYFAQEESARKRGIERHRELSGVDTDPGLEARSGGRHWFDGTYRALNEASIVTATGEIYRPDRVLISRDGSRVIVIDYKFGEPRRDHHSQVRNYIDLLRGMGYPSVEGWLWYLSDDSVVPA